MKRSVLFLCVRNAARSILAEYLLRKLPGDRFDVASAGTEPAEEVHPLTFLVLKDHFQINALGATPKNWNLFKERDFDFVISLCREVREICPHWVGQPQVNHWDIPDPNRGNASDSIKQLLFVTVAQDLRARLTNFCQLSEGKLQPYLLSKV